MITRVMMTLVAGLLAPLASAWAQTTWPARPVRLIVPFAVGGGMDISARIFAPKLAELLGQQVLVDNRPGAGAIIGTDLVAKAAPDGYTVLYGESAAFGINPWLYKKLPYDPDQDFEPVGQAIITSFTLSIHRSVPATDTRSFVALIKANPGKYVYGSPGLGTLPHLCGEQFKAVNGGLELVHVPYRGAGPAVNDLSAGQIAASFLVPATLIPHREAGTLRALGVGTPERDPALADVPTLQEQGLTGFNCLAWFGLMLPAKTPEPIVKRLNEALNITMADATTVTRLKPTGLRPAAGTTPDGFRALVKQDRANWGPVIKAIGMQLD